MKPRVKAQLHSSSARSSKIIRDHTQIETVVEVEGVGRLVLDVDSRGGYSLRAYPEGSEDPSRDLLAVGVLKADGILAVQPQGLSAVDGEQADPGTERTPNVWGSHISLPLFTRVRGIGILGTSQKKVSNLVHLGDAPTTIEEDATTVTRKSATSREGAGQLPAPS